MEDLKLSEAQSRYFGDLFLCCCDNEASGKVSYEKATELFRSASLNADLVRQVRCPSAAPLLSIVQHPLTHSLPLSLLDSPHCTNWRGSDSDLA